MDFQTILSQSPYGLNQCDKEQALVELLNDLVNYHYQNCPSYKRIVDLLYRGSTQSKTVEAFPYLPVNIFKEMRLMSIPESMIFKTLQSSGTTSSIPSQIILDSQTAHRQTIALASIMESFLGPKRLPMLIIDTPQIVKDHKVFSARAAGVVGMSHFGRNHFWALDENMHVNHSLLKEWLLQNQGSPIFIFGFTYLIWQHLFKESKPKEIDLSNGILFHSGGWKKLQEISIDNKLFKSILQSHFNLRKCHNFYGLVEQVGSIFTECEEGNLHCPCFADIVIRDPLTWLPAPIGQTGIVQVLSIIPTSYPGHSLLTEDLGQIKGIDTCPCGRKGKFFWIEGRVPEAEPRGCGDTYGLQMEGR